MASHPVCIFWDNSNIFHSAQRAAEQREGLLARKAVRVQFDNLFRVAAVGRKVTRAYCVGSVPPDLAQVWTQLEKKTGVKPELYERGKETGKEQGVDQCLQVWMLRCLADVRPPQIAVLLTGDGAGYADGAGFHADLERLHQAGWGIEVVSWDLACAGKLKTWASSVGVFVRLEDFYESVTFLEGGRQSKQPSLTRRATSTPAVCHFPRA